MQIVILNGEELQLVSSRLTDADATLIMAEYVVYDIISQFRKKGMEKYLLSDVILAAHLMASYREKYTEELFQDGTKIQDVLFDLINVNSTLSDSTKEQLKNLFNESFEVKE